MRYMKFLYMGAICMTKSIFYGGSCDFFVLCCAGRQQHTYSHVTCKSLCTYYKSGTHAENNTHADFSNAPRGKLRWDQTG